MAKISDAFPVIDVSIVLNGDISKVSTEELVKDKNVVLVGVPGACTPTCHAQHLPGYIENIDEFTEKGYSVIFMSVNDPFVINAWGEFNNANKKIKMMSDIGGVLAKRMDIEEDFGPNLLMRMKRFAMIILDNQIKNYVIDESGDYAKTDAENIITVLKKIL